VARPAIAPSSTHLTTELAAMRRSSVSTPNGEEPSSSDSFPSPPSDSETPPPAPPGGDSSDLVGLYVQIFGRPPLGDHPKIDGYAVGRVLAQEYPDQMMQVMSGLRQGAKEAAETAGGQWS